MDNILKRGELSGSYTLRPDIDGDMNEKKMVGWVRDPHMEGFRRPVVFPKRRNKRLKLCDLTTTVRKMCQLHVNRGDLVHAFADLDMDAEDQCLAERSGLF